jgi:hypothetical protein
LAGWAALVARLTGCAAGRGKCLSVLMLRLLCAHARSAACMLCICSRSGRRLPQFLGLLACGVTEGACLLLSATASSRHVPPGPAAKAFCATGQDDERLGHAEAAACTLQQAQHMGGLCSLCWDRAIIGALAALACARCSTLGQAASVAGQCAGTVSAALAPRPLIRRLTCLCLPHWHYMYCFV